MLETSIISTLMGLNLPVVFLLLASVVYWAYVFITFYHLARFGVGPKPKLFALIFLTGSVIIFTLILFFYNKVNLQEITEGLKTLPYLELKINNSF